MATKKPEKPEPEVTSVRIHRPARTGLFYHRGEDDE